MISGLDLRAADRRGGRPRRHRRSTPTAGWSAPAAGCSRWSGTGADLEQAREQAYAGIGRIELAGSFYRTDIAAAAALRRAQARQLDDRQRARQPVRLRRPCGTIWSAENKIIAERRLWLAVLAAQTRSRRRLRRRRSGRGDRRRTRRCSTQVDLASIAEREKITRHDVKARIEEFNALAGYEHVHKGMTSRDLTENVEQLQIVSAAAAGPRPDGHARWSGSASWPPATPTSRSPAARTTSRPR